MSTCTTERRVAAASVSGDAFNEALCEEHNATALDLVERLLAYSFEEPLRDPQFLVWRWGIIANSIEWQDIAVAVRRAIALMLYNHKEGQYNGLGNLDTEIVSTSPGVY